MSSNDDTPDAELLERYRQASRTEALAPRDPVRAAILEEGRRVAATVSATSSLEQLRRRPTRWKMTAFATAATLLLAAVVIAPRLWQHERAGEDAGAANNQFRQAAVRKVQPNAAEYASTPPVHIAQIDAARPPKATSIQPQTRNLPAPAAMPYPGRSMALDAQSQRSNAAAQSSADAFARHESISETMPAAAATGDTAKAAKLLEQGRFVDELDEAGRTPLMLAVAEGNLDMVRLLLAHGADPNAADAAGVTPLKQAQQRGVVGNCHRAHAVGGSLNRAKNEGRFRAERPSWLKVV